MKEPYRIVKQTLDNYSTYYDQHVPEDEKCLADFIMEVWADENYLLRALKAVNSEARKFSSDVFDTNMNVTVGKAVLQKALRNTR